MSWQSKTEPRHPMLPKNPSDIVEFWRRQPPKIICIVDAEEEFDWSQPFSTRNTSVRTIRAQVAAQKIFARFSLIPTYAVDYPVASQEEGYAPLREFLQDGLCEIGAQLHPWVTPPHEEVVGEANSFSYNLSKELQRKKVASLTEAIERNFGVKPKLFRTGRYGAGSATVGILQEFGYEVDCSVLPGPPITRYSPDYSSATARPYWLGSGKRILEIPVTAATVGPMRVMRTAADRAFTSPFSQAAKVPAILARAGILNRVRLTPEGNTLEEAKMLTRALLRQGHSVFAMSYHSPSLEPGKTPYTRDRRDVERLLGWIEGYLEFFMSEIDGHPATPGAIRRLALAAGPHVMGSTAENRQGQLS